LKLRKETWALGVLLFASVLPVAAQPQEPERWRLLGSLGVNLSKTTQTPLIPVSELARSSDYSTASGDLRLTLGGFVKDPALLPFTVDFTGERGSNSVDIGSFRHTILSWGINTVFLPERPFPLRFYYRKNQFDSRGATFGQDSDNSSLGLDWSLRLPKLPRFSFGYNRFATEVRVPTSITDTSYRQNLWRVGAEDKWKGWDWGIGFDQYSSVANAVAGFALPTELQQTLRVLGANIRRSFWNQKAQLIVDNRSQWLKGSLPGQGSTQSTDSITSTNLRVQHTPKLASSYYYTHTRVRLTTEGAVGGLPGVPGQIIFVAPPSFVSHFAGGRVDYRLTESVNLNQEIRYYRITPPITQFEVRESLTESLSGVNYQKSWRGLELGGSYVGRWQLMGTSLGNTANTFSNNFDVRLGWGDVRRLRLAGTTRYSKLNLVDQLGGFTEERRVRFELQTARLRPFRVLFSADRAYIELLNVSGDTKQDVTNLSGQVSHSRLAFSYTRTLGEGAGALFPSLVQLRQRITIPLPLDQLGFTPLLDRTTRANAVSLTIRPISSLELSGYWRSEFNLLASAELRFRQSEARARYRLGKFTFETGFGNFRTEILAPPQPSGLEINRYFLRVARDFQVF